MEQVTIAGRAYLLGAPDCIAPAFRSELAVATNNSFSNFKVLDYDSRDTNWVTRSDTDFNGNIRDESHGIFHLQMPISLRRNVDNKVMHDGYNALAGEQNILAERFHSSNNLLTTDTDRNSGAFRLLIEPPYNNSKYADADDIKNQKLAHKADIRIINGIWFVRNQVRQSENNWPGVPIWSDHMGNYGKRTKTRYWDLS